MRTSDVCVREGGGGYHKSTRGICCDARLEEIGTDANVDAAAGTGVLTISRLTASTGAAGSTLLYTMADLRMMRDSGKRSIDMAYLRQKTMVVTQTCTSGKSM